jgi:hypothetical protein
MTWTGRFRQVQSADGMSLIYSLDSADVLDTDGDGLGDTLEDGLDGYSALNEDSNDDGVSDRVEYESSQSN